VHKTKFARLPERLLFAGNDNNESQTPETEH